MSVKVRLGTMLTGITNGRGTIEIPPCTLGQCVARLERDYPGAQKALADPLVHFFVNWDEAVLPDDARRMLRSGDEVQIHISAIT